MLETKNLVDVLLIGGWSVGLGCGMVTAPKFNITNGLFQGLCLTFGGVHIRAQDDDNPTCFF